MKIAILLMLVLFQSPRWCISDWSGGGKEKQHPRVKAQSVEEPFKPSPANPYVGPVAKERVPHAEPDTPPVPPENIYAKPVKPAAPAENPYVTPAPRPQEQWYRVNGGFAYGVKQNGTVYYGPPENFIPDGAAGDPMKGYHRNKNGETVYGVLRGDMILKFPEPRPATPVRYALPQSPIMEIPGVFGGGTGCPGGNCSRPF